MSTSPTTSGSAVDQELVSMMRAVFTAHRDGYTLLPDVAGWDAELWSSLTGLGLARLTGTEESGGSGATWLEAMELLRAAAAAGVAVPLVEHDLLACWLLELAGAPVDSFRRTACVVNSDGVAHHVGWADGADRIVVLFPSGDGWEVADIDRSKCTVSPGRNRAGEPRSTVCVGDVTALNGIGVPRGTAEQFVLRGALARAIQVTGALESILDLSLDHVGSRVQFGRSLAKFQAVQHAIADIAAETALARTATEVAVFEALRSDWGPPTRFKVAVARSCVGHAASVAVRAGHQLHGAIGTTREHRLHEFSRPALAWRAEFGSVASWNRVVSEAAVMAGPGGLWPLISA